MGLVEPFTYDPAGLLPSQAEHSARDTPERSLWFSVLCQGLQDASGAPHDVTGCSPATRRARGDRLTVAARAWVASNASRPRSFRWCCEIFELDADLVRARLKAGEAISFDREIGAGSQTYAMLVKQYGTAPEAEKRYSPPVCQAGVTDRLFSYDELVGIVDEWEASQKDKEL